MFFQLPNARNPISRADGTTQDYWYRFLSSIYAKPLPESSLAITASPYTFTAPYIGQIVIVGGTVQLISLVRSTTVATGLLAGIFTLGRGDQITVTYTVAPTMTFLPL